MANPALVFIGLYYTILYYLWLNQTNKGDRAVIPTANLFRNKIQMSFYDLLLLGKHFTLPVLSIKFI